MRFRSSFIPLVLAAALAAQTPAPRSVIGTVSAFQPEQAAFEVTTDSGAKEKVQMSTTTMVQQVAPGEKDLNKAQPFDATKIAIGDRVLVSWTTGAPEARRVVVMGANEIQSKKDADRLDWQQHGLAGVVESVRGQEITVKSRTFAGEKVSIIAVTEKTLFRRYKQDSVKFSDAVPSSLAEVKKGDQLRGRGAKSADGGRVDAGEVVFGSFATRAGAVTAVRAEAGEVAVKDIETGKPFVIKVTADSQLKQMPKMAGGMARPGGPMAGGMPGGGMRGPGGAPEIAQMLERMPAIRITDLQAGETVLVSSTRGASKDLVTAIMLLANAETLIQMATASSRQSTGGLSLSGPGLSGGVGGMSGGLGGLELPTMMP
ncbi:MAG: hypothetical protein HY821_23545 [Acidobacteria bacterium]|nr:hypothetical protein [Acidobacteriota bacterium]